MDRFTKYSLLTMSIIVVVMIVSAYIGYMVGGNIPTDETINNLGGGGTSYSPFVFEALGPYGEYLGFFTAGAVGGFIVGYLLPSILYGNTERRKI